MCTSMEFFRRTTGIICQRWLAEDCERACFVVENWKIGKSGRGLFFVWRPVPFILSFILRVETYLACSMQHSL